MRMIDPILSLAVSMYNSSGVYALLLGSGVSRSSGVPTGWEIVQDLIRRVAHLQGDDPPDPEKWFLETYGAEPDYSELLGNLARSPAERTKLLQAYFEPNEQERNEGRKLPSQAHRAIAELVSKGYIRVIVTTNFDRLMEQALVDVGVQPTVISSGNAAHGAMPLVHARCTVIKAHGDYLDPQFKNTRDELSTYEPEMDCLLDRVFDEYGLIVCGWSAEWDTALRAAIERCVNRRFSTYWAAREKCTERAEQLINLRGAVRLPITDADAFFSHLADRIAALESFAETDPVSAKVAVARVKQYLADEHHTIRLHDLLMTETERVKERTNNAHFPTAEENPTVEATLARLKRYDSELDTLLQSLACVAHFGKAETDDLVLRSFKRLAEESGPEGGMTFWLHMKRYPAVRVLYGIGLAALAAGNYRILKRLVELKIKKTESEGYKEYTAVTRLHDHAVIDRGQQTQLMGRAEHTPLCNYLFETLREPSREYLPGDVEYEGTFSWFEYLRCLCALDAKLPLSKAEALAASDKSDLFEYWIPVGRFGWNSSGVVDETVISGSQYPDKIAAVLRAGLFESGRDMQPKKFIAVKTLADRCTQRVRQQWGVCW
jgi:hypothetical protein